MLEPRTYRESELLAKSQIPSWRISQVHNVDHFERAGFPVRISSVRELGQLVDTMQENRFDAYMSELDGLTDADFDIVVRACCDVVDFQLTYLPDHDPVIPISTVMSAFAIYDKLRGFDQNFQTVLEIGPGCGYLSLFLKHHRTLQNYSQIEACESFYVFQSLINVHCFGARFDERALPPINRGSVEYFVNPRPDMETSPALRIPRSRPRCTHFPWWRIGEIPKESRQFDVVTSNANLLEFSRAALDDYLSLMHASVKPDGIFLVQCTGFTASGTVPELFEKLHEKKFAPLFFMQERIPCDFPGSSRGSVFDRLTGGRATQKIFAVNNGVFVRNGHPLFEKYFERSNYRMQWIAPEPLIDRMFFGRPGPRHRPNLDQIVKRVEADLVKRLSD